MDYLEFVRAQFPGRLMITLREAGHAIGYAEQTCYNLVHAGKFPIKVRKVGRKSMVSLMDLATYLAETNAACGQNEEAARKAARHVASVPIPVRRRPGRPTKAEQRARQILS